MILENIINTEVFNLTNENEYKKGMARAKEAILNGETVVFPTETVYGIGANALDENAVAKIFKAKGRPSDNPLIVHLSKKEDIPKIATSDTTNFEGLIDEFMPGALTIILDKKEEIPSTVTAGLDSVAIRIPSNDYARDFIATCGVPIAAPSANISGKPSPTRAEHVLEDMLGRASVILIADPCEIGVESTVLDLTKYPAQILRPGAITYENIKDFISVEHYIEVPKQTDFIPKSPGMKYRHYKPNAKVYCLIGSDEEIISYINKQQDGVSCAIVFEDLMPKINLEHIYSLGNRNTPKEAAECLFSHFRRADSEHIENIYITPTTNDGIGSAFLNRLYKATDEFINLKGVVMSEVMIFEHPLIQHKIGIIRNKETEHKLFRELVNEIAMLMTYEVTRDMKLIDDKIQTPMCETVVKKVDGTISIIPILRAGLGMVDGVLNILPNAKVGHIGMYRDHDTLEPVPYYCKLPEEVKTNTSIVVDPMLATGGSAISAINHLKKENAKDIKFMCLIASREGLNALQTAHPDVNIYCAALDEEMNECKYIIPGLGDAGDRLFGTK